MRHILILGAGKSATILIKTLLEEAGQQHWIIHVADASIGSAVQKVNGHESGIAYSFTIEDASTWHPLIELSDLVISMLPPSFHLLVAQQCLKAKKHFLNASYLSEAMKNLDEEVTEKGLLFLSEMGLDPGIDHMSAMEIMDNIKEHGGEIHSFRSHCGGLISPESDDNPWHYKISWNPKNIITAGKDGARFLENGQIINMSYNDLFDPNRTVDIPEIGTYAWYPNRDSLPYKRLYGLDKVKNLVRTTLRHPDFCAVWNVIVNSGLTIENELINTESITYKDYFNKKLNKNTLFSTKINEQLSYAGFDDDVLINMGIVSPAYILEKKLEETLCLQTTDKDMVVMLHEIEYVQNGAKKRRRDTLVIKGDNGIHTAMAKTVGLPLAIAAKLLLNGIVTRRGVEIPICKEIYEPVLKELKIHGINFKSTF